MKDCTQEVSNKLMNFKVFQETLCIHRSIKRSNYVDEFLVTYMSETLMEISFKILHEDITSSHRGYERTLKKFRKKI